MTNTKPSRRKILVGDLFCGAGGSSSGARQAIEQLGRQMLLTCVNHWDRAIETHKRMHPEARHYCQDVASARPMECVPEGRLDLLMASPTCTYHSRARGGRPTSDQQRMDPWHVVTWLSELRVRRLLIENVPEFVDWGPVDAKTGKPLKSKKGLYFREWIATLERLGYRVEHKILNCADYGDATTRRRFFLMARNDGKPIRWPEPTHAKDPAHDLLAPRQKWRPARECIDWALRGRSIFGRKHPLAPRTIQRIYAGAVRLNWPEPFLVVLRQHMDARSIELPLPTVAARGTHIGLAVPVIVGNGGAQYAGKPKSVDEPLTTVLTQDRRGVAEPLLIRSDAHGAKKLRARPVDEPVQTIVGSGGIGIAEPFIMSGHAGGAPRSVDEPIPGMTAKNNGPLVVEPFLMANRTNNVPKSVDGPVPTNTTTTGGGVALISPYYGSGSGLTCKSVEQPMDTITVKDRLGLICPVTHGGGGNIARDITSPFPTLTTSKGGHLAFITASFGERDGQLPRVHDLQMPMPTIPATGSVRLAQGEEGEGGQQYDILFRMLHWRELARAMSFSDADSDYEFAGTKTEITKQIGNAVPVRTARALVGAALWDMAA
jgi:DNA (cytosine-5)-methyltransferase 1